jgi:hypothetical protein
MSYIISQTPDEIKRGVQKSSTTLNGLELLPIINFISSWVLTSHLTNLHYCECVTFTIIDKSRFPPCITMYLVHSSLDNYFQQIWICKTLKSQINGP